MYDVILDNFVLKMIFEEFSGNVGLNLMCLNETYCIQHGD